MHPRRLLRVAAALRAVHATPAHAQGLVTPSIGFNFGADATNCSSLRSCDDKRTSWGVAIGSTGGIFGFEEEFAYAPNFFGTASGGDNAVLTLMSNLLVVIPAGPGQPYGLVGIGLVRPHGRLNPARPASDKNTPGWDIGGGLNIFFTHAVGIHGDVRHVRT